MTASLTFDAGTLARGWLATIAASANDENVPVLDGTLLIETFSDGARLTATDRTILLTTWIPSTDSTDDEQGLDVAPESVTVVRDPDGRGKALLSYLRKLATKAAKEDALVLPVATLHVGVPAEEGDEAGFPGMELDTVVIEYPEHERVVLPTVDGTFPNYRTLLAGHTPKRTDRIAFSPLNLERLAQVGKVLGAMVHTTLAGPKSAVAVEVGTVAPVVRGVVMPVAVAELEAVAS
jgi:hypothetical protein